MLVRKKEKGGDNRSANDGAGLKSIKRTFCIVLGCLLLVALHVTLEKGFSLDGASKRLDDKGKSKGKKQDNACEDCKIFTTLAGKLPVSGEMLASLGLSAGREVEVMNLKGGTSNLKGRFLHITDMHPDLFYKEGSSIDSKCHVGTPESADDEASRFGNAMAGCDSSADLVYYTLDWVKENLGDKIDFIVWTGDNVRHDNDRAIPRTEAQIFDLNREISDKFVELFRNESSPDPYELNLKVIPSLGNNDVFPHNMFSLGPTLQTRELFNIWSGFIPPEQQHTFDRSTSFFVEVIPGKLAVISLNTLYMFKGNPLVDDCNSKKQPGYELLLWLGYTLQELRERNMKAWITGHVPPIPKNFDASCANKFALWMHEYNDVIIGGLYGHMNLDHFVPLDGKQAWDNVLGLNVANDEYSGDIFNDEEDEDSGSSILEHAIAAREIRLQGAKPVNKGAYMNSVRDTYYAKIAKIIQESTSMEESTDSYFERFSIVHVGASVIPTFNPGFRVWEYNISALQTDEAVGHSFKPWTEFFGDLQFKMDLDILEDELIGYSVDSLVNEHDYSVDTKKKKKNKKKKKKNWWKSDKSFPPKKPAGTPPGPAYEAQLFTPTRFVQYYADLGEIDKEYRELLKQGKTKSEAASLAFKYKVEYTSDQGPYPMKSLLVKDYAELASHLFADDKKWAKYLERAYACSGYED